MPKRILFAAGCEPTAVYRIMLEARALASRYSVDLQGLRIGDAPPPPLDEANLSIGRAPLAPLRRAMPAAIYHYTRYCVRKRKIANLFWLLVALLFGPLLALPILLVLSPVIAFVVAKTLPRAAKRLLRATKGLVRRAILSLRRAIYAWVGIAINQIAKHFIAHETLKFSGAAENGNGETTAIGASVEAVIAKAAQARETIESIPESMPFAFPAPVRATELTAEELIPLEKRLAQFAFEFHRATDDSLSRTGGAFQTFALLRMFLNRSLSHFNYWCKSDSHPDAVHVKDLDTLLFGYLVSTLTGAKLVYNFYEYFPVMSVKMPLWGSTLAVLYEHFLIKRATQIIAVNDSMGHFVRKTHRLDLPIHSIPNVDPTPQLDSGPDSHVRSPVRFIYQGLMAPQRGLEELIIAFQEVDESKAVLYVRGPENKYANYCKLLAKVCGCYDRSVVFTDPIIGRETFADSLDALQHFDVGFCAYHSHNRNYLMSCPRKLSHYTHAGLMILSSEIPFAMDLLQESNCGMTFDIYDKESIQSAVGRCIDDPDWVEQCKKNALVYAKEHYNWDHYQQKLLAIYDETL